MGVYERKLADPIEYFDKRVGVVYLLEPRASHLARFGEPALLVFSAKTGSSYDALDEEAIAKYLDALLSLDGKAPAEGGGRALFAHLSLVDGIALRDALLGFFLKAKVSLISAPSTGSSSTSA